MTHFLLNRIIGEAGLRRFAAIGMVLLLSGCGIARNIQMNNEIGEAKKKIETLKDECKARLQNPNLDPIRNKLVLWNDPPDTPPPSRILGDASVPTPIERAALQMWGDIRDDCFHKANVLAAPPLVATPSQAAIIQQDNSFFLQAMGLSNQLLVALEQDKLTYGEFSQRNYEIVKQAMDTERSFRMAVIAADQQRQAQEQKQFQDALLTWAALANEVNARRPIVTTTNCTNVGTGVACSSIAR
jgi:hypothetical protein